MAYLRGQPAPNRGIPHKESTKKKISESCRKAGVGKWNAGLIHTEEHRKRVSEGLVKYYKVQEHRDQHSQRLRKYYLNHSVWNKGLRHTEGSEIEEV